MKTGWLVPAGVLLAALPTGRVGGRAPAAEMHHAWRPRAANLVVPQSRIFRNDAAPQAVSIDGLDAAVSINERVATTVLDISLSNPGGAQQQAELLVPVPDGAVMRGFTFQGAGAEPTAELLRREEARRIYDGIVAHLRDPALLEFAGLNLVRSSVFPVPAHGRQKLRLTYEHVLPAEGNRFDYLLPRSESLDCRVPWTVRVRVRDSRPIAAVYSPSHAIDVVRNGPGEASVRLAGDAGREPGPFRLSCLLESGDSDEVTASLIAHPDAQSGGGYFLLLAGMPVTPRRAAAASGIRREVTLVLDRSGSMNGGKLEQARAAALRVIAGLQPGERFNVIAYNEGVDPLWDRPMVMDAGRESEARRYLERMTARGGTNIHDALAEALRPAPESGALPIVLFLTDGLPTVGQTSEKAIRELAARHNPHGHRIFTFGAGVDVNTPLLERLAGLTRAACTFVLPGENIETKVAGVLDRLDGPVLTGPRLDVLDAAGGAAGRRLTELEPGVLPDLFSGDQLVLLGRYSGGGLLKLRLSGNFRGQQREFDFTFDLEKADIRHPYVPRLWAARRIAVLSEAVRDLGAEAGPPVSSGPGRSDGRLRELVDEIVRLSTEFGVLSEYTSFLAREGTDLERRDALVSEAAGIFQKRALGSRSGMGSASQDMNLQVQKGRAVANMRNSFLDEKLQRVEVSGVQQVADRAYYRRGGRWVDSRLVLRGAMPEPAEVVEMGSPEHRELVVRLTERGINAAAALPGEAMIEMDGRAVLVK